jgi:hypothetical protein
MHKGSSKPLDRRIDPGAKICPSEYRLPLLYRHRLIVVPILSLRSKHRTFPAWLRADVGEGEGQIAQAVLQMSAYDPKGALLKTAM